MNRLALLLGLIGPTALPVASTAPQEPWRDNDRQFKSDDPKFNFRRSEHFRIQWGKGVGEGNSNNDFPQVTEQLVQANLQMLEQVWKRYHDAAPSGINFRIAADSINGKINDRFKYRTNLVLNNTGVWEGGAWGSIDEWGLPLFALPPGYMAVDPPSGATPHEFGHTILISAGGFNETPWDGMWHEASANWLMLQFNNAYPNPFSVAVQPYFSIPHGRNYYDAWPIWETLREDPRYGAEFFNKVWTGANGNRAKGGEYMMDSIIRLSPAGIVDKENALRDAFGKMAAKSVAWDYERGPFFRQSVPRKLDPLSELTRRGISSLERKASDPRTYRIPFSVAPMQGGYNVVPIELVGKKGGGYSVTLDFKPLWDPTRGSDWRATMVAVNDSGEARYSAPWNGGKNTMVLSSDENQLFLAVAATPTFLPFEGFQRPQPTAPTLQPQSYEVSFIDTNARPWIGAVPAPNVPGKRHPNGGGFVADTAKVDASAFVGKNALVLGEAQVRDRARVEDYAVVMDRAVVRDDARVSGHALVKERAQVYGFGKARDWATVGGEWQIFEHGRALERAYLMDRGQLHGNATIKGATADYGNADVKGHAIKEGDCANGVPIDKQTLMCWVWGFDQAYADSRPSNEALYCNFRFERTSPIFALDTYGLVHGTLAGGSRVAESGAAGLGKVLKLNGKDGFVELKRDVADLREGTYAVWVRWDGSKAGNESRIFHFESKEGDKAKHAYLTPKDRNGRLAFVIREGNREKSLTAPALSPNRWTHVALTFQDNGATLYVDGKEAARAPQFGFAMDSVLGSNSTEGTTHAFLGRGATGGWFAGALDDWAVYSQPQSPEAIRDLAAKAKIRTAPVNVPAIKATVPGRPAFLEPPTFRNGAIVMSSRKSENKFELGKGWIQYRFTRNDGVSSGWISTNRWTDAQIVPGSTMRYRVQVRNRAGGVSAVSTEATVKVPKHAAPPIGEFSIPPTGLSATSVRMTAKAAPGMEVRFRREGGKESSWMSGRTWTDSGLGSGSRQRYRVQFRNAEGKVGAWSEPVECIVRDDTPPARFNPGEWQTRPFATVQNEITMKAMSVTGADGTPRIENDPVEYYFECVSGGGPDSGWVTSAKWTTPPLKDGTYVYRFKMRDTSPQKNETGYSSGESASVTPFTGYHPASISAVGRMDEGSLVSFSGTVAEVAKDHYIVSEGQSRIKVVPATKGDATDPSLAGKRVSVRGGVWIVSGEKRVTWAEVKAN